MMALIVTLFQVYVVFIVSFFAVAIVIGLVIHIFTPNPEYKAEVVVELDEEQLAEAAAVKQWNKNMLILRWIFIIGVVVVSMVIS